MIRRLDIENGPQRIRVGDVNGAGIGDQHPLLLQKSDRFDGPLIKTRRAYAQSPDEMILRDTINKVSKFGFVVQKYLLHNGPKAKPWRLNSTTSIASF
ncbi:hypothetical protein PCAR4_20009 [Paraburkholderia caribensis]|nr:hypothetical protein PCAR4_20009 [Paraburkholderia caribensis]